MRKNETAFVLLVLALAALLGMGLVWYATTQGAGVGGDATIYLTSARNLLAGKGLGWTEADGSFRLLPYTPPFYPLVLAGVGLLYPHLLAAARWLNIALFGATIFLLGWSFSKALFMRRTPFTRQPLVRVGLAGIFAGVLATSPVLLGVQVWAMSEPLFLFLGFAGLLALLADLRHPRLGWLVLGALLTGLAFLTRYMGVAFILTGGLALLFFGRVDDARVRLRWPALGRGILFGLLAVLPALIWFVIDFSLTGTVGSRSAQPAAAYYQRFLEIGPALQKIVLFWLLPDSLIARLPRLLKIVVWLLPLLALFGLYGWLAGRRSGVSEPETPASPALLIRQAQMSALFCGAYLVVLTLVQVFTFPPITLAARMLSPVHLAVLWLVFTLAALLWNALPRPMRVLPALIGLACLGLFGMYALRGALVARDYHRAGIGYMTAVWQESSTIALVKMLAPDIPVISNETTAIMFLADRPAYALQEIYQDRPITPFNVYGAGDDAAQRVFREQGGAFVLFKSTLADDFAMYGDQADARLKALTAGLYPYYEGQDGAIYFWKKPDFLPKDDCT